MRILIVAAKQLVEDARAGVNSRHGAAKRLYCLTVILLGGYLTMFKRTKLLVAAVGASAVLGSGVASAVEFRTSDWTFSATGNINAHYIFTMCDSTTHVVAGSLLCNTAPGEQRNSSSIANGLLPAAIVFGAATTQNDIDIAATVGFYPGIASNDFGLNGPNIPGGGRADLFDLQQNGLDTTNLDLRQVFLTFGNDTFGEIKMGRDFGLFGYDAIINDMTLPGVGVAQTFAARSPVNTTLGSIGFGYIYVDTPAQINYTTPSLAGLTATVGVFQPYDAFNLSGFSAQTTNATSNQPGFHAKLAYEWAGAVPGFLSVSGITEDVRNLTVANAAGVQVQVPGEATQRAYAGDVTGKVTAFGLDLLASYYYTQGWGHTGFLFDGFDALGQRRKSTGYLGQVTYTFGNTKIGANYGVNNLSANPIDPPQLLHQNAKWTVGLYHNLTPNLTLLTEYSNARSVNNLPGGDINTQNINVGAFLAF
jgi:predicted porin